VFFCRRDSKVVIGRIPKGNISRLEESKNRLRNRISIFTIRIINIWESLTCPEIVYNGGTNTSQVSAKDYIDCLIPFPDAYISPVALIPNSLLIFTYLCWVLVLGVALRHINFKTLPAGFIHVFLGAVVALLLLWRFDVSVTPGLGYHFSTFFYARSLFHAGG